MSEGQQLAHDIAAQERTEDVRLKELAPFSKMPLAERVRKGLHQAGFVYPTTIQSVAIPVGKSGLDLLIQSKSGTGKTLIFSAIVLNAYRCEIREPQSLIVVPTRELAVQVETVLKEIGHFCSGFRTVCVIGGLDVTDDRKRLQGAKAVVGTPGRLLHLIQNEVLNTSQIRTLVLDEADKMYTHKIRADLERILKALPPKRQTIACSATFCNGLDRELAKVMRNPFLISTEEKATALVGIKQFTYEVAEQKTSILEMESKLDGLRDVFGRIAFKQCLVFAGSQSRAESYRNYLEKDGWPCELISGAQDQKTRLAMFRKFKEFKTRILLATDLMSRGVDSEHVNLVINLEPPTDAVTYLHRIGRAGRFGSHGIAISFIASEKERSSFKRLCAEVGIGLRVLRFPRKSDKEDESNFWDFSALNFEKESQQFGLFGDDSANPSKLMTALVQENKENETDNVGNSMSSSIDTKTFQINSKDSVFNMVDFVADNNLKPHQKVTPDSHLSSSQQLPSSNTIDDASSIAADSVRSSQQDNSHAKLVSKLKTAIPTLVELLIDQNPATERGFTTDAASKAAAARQPPVVDLFDDYRKSVLRSTDDSLSKTEEKTEEKSDEPQLTMRKLSNYKSLLIDAPASTGPVSKKVDIYSDYENFDCADGDATTISQNTASCDTSKATFVMSIGTPPNACDTIEELQNSSPDLNHIEFPSETQSLAEMKHFPSPVQERGTAAMLPPHLPKKQQQLTVNLAARIEIPPVQVLPHLGAVQYGASSASSSADEHLNNDHEIGDSSSVGSAANNGQRGTSSGFNETTSSASSGIETSEVEEGSFESYETEDELDESSDDYTMYNESEVEDEDEDVDDDDDDEDEEGSNATGSESDCSASADPLEAAKRQKNSSFNANHSYNLAYQTAYKCWNDMYQNQVRLVQDYVKICQYVKKHPN